MSHRKNQLKKKKERECAVKKKILTRRIISRRAAKEVKQFGKEEKEAIGNPSELEKILGISTNHVVIDEKI